jgi:hypothetical protein
MSHMLSRKKHAESRPRRGATEEFAVSVVMSARGILIFLIFRISFFGFQTSPSCRMKRLEEEVFCSSRGKPRPESGRRECDSDRCR